jgi:hypothetical protein
MNGVMPLVAVDTARTTLRREILGWLSAHV